MDDFVDHYAFLGLPSGEDGAKLSDQAITKAYRSKAMECHPDKRPDDPNAHDNFLKLQESYRVLKDESARKLFDDLLRVKREKIQRQGQQDSKRRKMMSDLERREQSAFTVDPISKEREEEERISRKLKAQIDKIKAMYSNKKPDWLSSPVRETKGNQTGNVSVLDKAKVLKVSWEKSSGEYTAERLGEIFKEFGEVEDVVIKSTKKKGAALVVMASKDAAVAAIGNVLGDLSNPLLVVPLQPSASPVVFSDERERDDPKMGNVVGAGHKKFEESVLEKMLKKQAAQKTQ